MENKLRRQRINRVASIASTCAMLPSLVLATPSISDRPSVVKVLYDNEDRLEIRCDSTDRCSFDVSVFRRKFHLSETDASDSGQVIPTTAVLTPVSEDELTYYIKVSSFCGKDDFKLRTDVHFELNCYSLIKAKGNKVVSVERIVEQADVVRWSESKPSR